MAGMATPGITAGSLLKGRNLHKATELAISMAALW